MIIYGQLSAIENVYYITYCPSGKSLLGVKASGKFCNIPPIHDEMVLSVLFTYIINR